MNRLLSGSLVLALFAACSCQAAGRPDTDAAKAAWAALVAAIDAKDQNRAQAFVGKAIWAEGGRHGTNPNLSLSLKLSDGRLLMILVTSVSPSSHVGREIRKVQKWSAPFVDAAVIGT